MNYLKCKDYPCIKVRELLEDDDKLDYLFMKCRCLNPSTVEQESRKELQCDLCRIETIIEGIADGKLECPNAAELGILCSESKLPLTIFLSYDWWHTQKLSCFGKAKYWFQLLLSKE